MGASLGEGTTIYPNGNWCCCAVFTSCRWVFDALDRFGVFGAAVSLLANSLVLSALASLSYSRSLVLRSSEASSSTRALPNFLAARRRCSERASASIGVGMGRFLFGLGRGVSSVCRPEVEVTPLGG